MALDAKLERWRAAGLIDASQTAAIAAYESEHGRPVALWAVVALGLLALALGITLVVAANWDAIPAAVKLGVHMAATVAIGALVLRAASRSQLWTAEGALFAFAAMVLAGLALQGQVYQLVAPAWVALGWWALIVSPLILVAGATRLTALGWSAMLAALALSYTSTVEPGDLVFGQLLADNLVPALPPALVALSLLLPGRPDDDPFRRGLREAGLAMLLIGASVAHLAWAIGVSRSEAAEFLVRVPVALGVSAVAVLAATRAPRDQAAVIRVVVAAALATTLLAVAVPHGDTPLVRLVGAISFALLWGAVAKAAHDGGWRTLFGVAVAMIALRLFIVYFELFGGLAQTGGGLIVAGLLVIGLAAGWRRIVRRA